MISDKVFFKERFEYQRSTLSQIRSTFMHLDQNVRMIQKNYEDVCPPILYSDSFCENVLHLIKDAEDDLKCVNITSDHASDYGSLVIEHRNISDQINVLMTILTSFQRLHDQRISGLHFSGIIEYQPALQSEYSLFTKIYNAVDALSYQLMKSCFGQDWIRKEQYVPLSLFDQEYAILRLSGSEPGSLVTIPYYDCFRTSFWPGLAHEVAHIMVTMVTNIEDYNPLLLDCMKAWSDALLFTLFTQREIKNYPKIEKIITKQISELTSDIIATYICGPASLFSASTMLPFSGRWGHGTFYESVRSTSHPPIEVRVAAMQRILEDSGLPLLYPLFNEMSEGVNCVLTNKNYLPQDVIDERMGGYTEQSCDFDMKKLPIKMHEYREEATFFAEDLMKILDDSGLKPFTDDEWSEVTDTLTKREPFDGLNPIQLTNLVWAVRLRKGMDNRNLPIRQFFDKNMNEQKLFEITVNHMYTYYESVVVPEVKRYQT
jgi:hypothetical protein